MGICETCKKPFYGMGRLCENCKTDIIANRKAEKEEKAKKEDWRNLSIEEQRRAMEEKRRDKSFWMSNK
jgi:predicted amidophosphoribosyltransferase